MPWVWVKEPGLHHILKQLNHLERMLETVAIDQSQFDADFNPFITAVNDYITAVNAYIAAVQAAQPPPAVDLTAEDAAVKTAATALAAAATAVGSAKP